MKSTTKTAVTMTVTAISVVVISVACAVWVKLKQEKNRVGGELVRVNYKFEKEFDD